MLKRAPGQIVRDRRAKKRARRTECQPDPDFLPVARTEPVGDMASA